jgi:hypothetical protein
VQSRRGRCPSNRCCVLYSPLSGNRLLGQFIEQRLGRFEIGGVEASLEPTEDWGEQGGPPLRAGLDVANPVPSSGESATNRTAAGDLPRKRTPASDQQHANRSTASPILFIGPPWRDISGFL